MRSLRRALPVVLLVLLVAGSGRVHAQQVPGDSARPPSTADQPPGQPGKGGQQPGPVVAPRRLSPDWWQQFLWDVRVTDIALVAFAGSLVLVTLLLSGRTARLSRATERLSATVDEQRADIQMSLEIARQSAQAAAESAQAMTTQVGNMAASLAIAENAATAADEAAKAATESGRTLAAQAGQVTASLGIAQTAATAADTSAKAAVRAATTAEKQVGDLMASVDMARAAADAAREMAGAARQRADTAIAAERPHVFASSLRLHGLKQPPGNNGLVTVGLSYEFVNYGRSPAWLKGIFLSVSTGQLPETPAYGQPIAVRQVIPVQGSYRSARPVDVFKLPPQIIEKLLKGEIGITAHGYVDYADSLGQDHRTAFIYAFTLKDGDESTGFHPVGPDAYWQYT